jgi:hypothetical protein
MLQAGKQMDVPEAPSAPSLLSEAGREPIKALRQRMLGILSSRTHRHRCPPPSCPSETALGGDRT